METEKKKPKKQQKNMKNQLKQYLADLDTEKFSGFTGQDGMDLDLGFSGADAGVQTQSCVRPARQAKSYSVTFTNNSAGANATYVLFGHNRYESAANYGSAATITITVGGGASYLELLRQSSTQNFRVNRMKIISSESTNVAQTITLTYANANGSSYTVPIALSEFQDVYQQNANMVDVTFGIKIDGTAFLTGIMAASSTLTFIIYPEAIADLSELLTNQEPVKQYLQPILSPVVPRQIGATTKL